MNHYWHPGTAQLWEVCGPNVTPGPGVDNHCFRGWDHVINGIDLSWIELKTGCYLTFLTCDPPRLKHTHLLTWNPWRARLTYSIEAIMQNVEAKTIFHLLVSVGRSISHISAVRRFLLKASCEWTADILDGNRITAFSWQIGILPGVNMWPLQNWGGYGTYKTRWHHTLCGPWVLALR